ncbi:MAG: hypothetical protein AMXMBFR64_20750 [Myxococcales bacterium]
MSGAERRVFHRYSRALAFEVEYRGQLLRATTVNTSTGGAFLRAPMHPEAGERLTLVIRTEPGGPVRLGLVAEVIHVMRGVGPVGLGVRWIEAHSEVGSDQIQTFLERVLGIAKCQIRRGSGQTGAPLWVFTFPDLMTRSMEDDATGLADLLEPARPDDAAEEAAAALEMEQQEKAARDPAARPGLVKRLSQIMRRVTSTGIPVPQGGGSERSDPERPDPERADPPGKVLPLPLLVRTASRKLKGKLFKLSRTTMGIAGVAAPPKVYERVTVAMPIPEKRKSVDVVITGSVTRVKEDGTFTVRFLKIDEQGHKGIFQDYLDHVLGKGVHGDDD